MNVDYNLYTKLNDKLINDCESVALSNHVNNGGILHFSNLVKDCNVVITATCCHKVVGFVAIRYYSHMIGYGYLEQIAILDNYKKQGIGTSLILQAIDYCKANKLLGMYANCRKENVASAKLLAKCGFSKCTMSDNAYMLLGFDKGDIKDNYAFRFIF